MRLSLLLLLLISIAPLGACADDSANTTDVEPIKPAAVTPDVADHPPLYDPDVHDGKVQPQPKLTYGQFVDRIFVNKLKMDREEFYAKNPTWSEFEDKPMPPRGTILGVFL